MCALGMRWGFGGGSRCQGGGSSRRLNHSRGGPRRRIFGFRVSRFVCVFEMVIGGKIEGTYNSREMDLGFGARNVWSMNQRMAVCRVPTTSM